MRSTALFVCTLALVLIPTAVASADLTVPGQRIIEVQCDLDFGPYKDYAARTYTVVEGDTLEKIAADKLGKASRWREITAINDAIDHKALKVGQTLWVPAAKTPQPADRDEREAVARPTAWWHFFAAPGGGHFGSTVERIAHGARVPHHHYYTTVFAVRSDRYAEFQKALDERADRSLGDILAAWKTKPGFAMGTTELPGRSSVSDQSLVRSRIETWKVTAIDGNEIRLEKQKSEERDGSGKVVQGMAGLFGVNGLLLALGFLALSGLIGLARRRKAAATQA